jgi:hypothetical protein
MACALTAGYSLDCKGVGGVKSVYIIELDNVEVITETAGVVTTLTKASAKRFWKYNQAMEVAEGKATQAGSEANGSSFWNHEISVVLQKRQTSVRNEILLLAQNRVIIVEEDKNGKYWMYGKNNGLYLDGGASGSGKAHGDLNGYTLTFKGVEKEDVVEVNNAIALVLETPGS